MIITPSNSVFCWGVGEYRFDINRQLKWAGGGVDPVGDYIGALGEFHVAKYFGIKWVGAKLDIPTYRSYRHIYADVGPFEVRATSSSKTGLRIKDNDKDFAIGVLIEIPKAWSVGKDFVSGYPPEINLRSTIVGWMPIKIARTKTQPGDFGPEVPRSELYDPSKLEIVKCQLDEWRRAGHTAVKFAGLTFELER